PGSKASAPPAAARFVQRGSARKPPAGTRPVIECRRRSRERASTGGRSDLEDAEELANGVRRLLQGRLLLGGEIDLDDLLDAAGAELHRHAQVHVPHSVLALQV